MLIPLFAHFMMKLLNKIKFAICLRTNVNKSPYFVYITYSQTD